MAEVNDRKTAIKIMEKALGDYNSTGEIKVQRVQLFQAFEVLKSQEPGEDLIERLEKLHESGMDIGINTLSNNKWEIELLKKTGKGILDFKPYKCITGDKLREAIEQAVKEEGVRNDDRTFLLF